MSSKPCMVITTWAYYGRSIVSYIFVARMIESVDPENLHVTIALLHEEDDHNPEDKEGARHRGQTNS